MEFKIILKKLNNTLSQSEKEIFDAWVNEKPEHLTYFNNVRKNYSNDVSNLDIEKAWREIELKTKATINKKVYLKYAAAILIFICSGYYLIVNNVNTEGSSFKPNTASVGLSVGTDKALLTIEDGTNIVLEKGENYISKDFNSNGKEIVYASEEKQNSEIEFHYLTVPRGGQFHMVLGDSTEVWLNSESKIKYPKNFIKGEIRKVELVYGEAYFDVFPSSKYEDSKFVVETRQQDIEVLGTEFNVKAYGDESQIYTTLVEGKVSITNGVNQKILKPSDQSVLVDNSNEILIFTVDVYDQISWKDGVFSFKHMPLIEIVKILSRWYDVDFVIENKDLSDEQFFGVLKKDQNIEDILLTIKNTNFIKNYEINEETKEITIE